MDEFELLDRLDKEDQFHRDIKQGPCANARNRCLIVVCLSTDHRHLAPKTQRAERANMPTLIWSQLSKKNMLPLKCFFAKMLARSANKVSQRRAGGTLTRAKKFPSRNLGGRMRNEAHPS